METPTKEIDNGTRPPRHWLPMETAPLDGTEILLQWNSLDGVVETWAVWNGELWVSRIINEWTGLPMICGRVMGWLAWGTCVWCNKPSTTTDRQCSAPDGDGHLFKRNGVNTKSK